MRTAKGKRNMRSAQKCFSIATKTFLVAVSFTLPIGVLLYLVVANINEFVRFAQWEQYGNTYQRPLEDLLSNVQEHHILVPDAQGDTAARLQAAQSGADRAFADLSQVDAQLGDALQFTDEGLSKRDRTQCRVDLVRAEWQELADILSHRTAGEKLSDDVQARYARLVSTIRTMITHAGDTSNLILDPDLDSYYLMDVTLLALPQTQDRIAQIINFGRDVLSRGALTQQERTQFAVYAALLQEADVDRITASAQTALNEDANFYGVSPTLQSKLPPAVAAYRESAGEFIALAKQAADPKAAPVDPRTFVAAGLKARVESFRLWNIAVDELDELLVARIDSYTSRRTWSLTLAGAAVLLAAGLAFIATLSITRPLNKLVRSLGPGATLLAASVDRIAEASKRGNTTPQEAGIICEELDAHADDMRSAVNKLELLVRGRANVRSQETTSVASAV
jgi:methyl-accepting chemotaxis protein